MVGETNDAAAPSKVKATRQPRISSSGEKPVDGSLVEAQLVDALGQAEIQIPSQQKPETPSAVQEKTTGHPLDYILTAAEARKKLSALRKSSKEENSAATKARETLSVTTEQISKIQTSLEELNVWRGEIASTYISLVDSRMKANLHQAQNDLSEHEKHVREWKLLEAGTLLRLRKQFHLGFGRTWLRATIAVGLLLLLTNLWVFKSVGVLAWIYNPVWSGPVIVALGIIAYYAAPLIRKFFVPQSTTRRKIRWRWLFIVLFWVVFFIGISRATQWLNENVVPFLHQHFWEILTAISVLAIISTLALLARYYSGWTVFRQAVTEQVDQLQGVIDGYVKTRQELTRLEGLYPQTIEWIELIANAVYRPWRTNPDWGATKEFSKEHDTFPRALRVAQAIEGADANMVALENAISKKLLVQGWRRQAFEDLVEEVAAHMGANPENFNVELLDKDLPHHSNNSRALLKRYLNHSAGNLADAPKRAARTSDVLTSLEPSDQYLVEVARKRLRSLIESTQAQILNTARPRVEQIIFDPLAEIRDETSGIDREDSSQSWQEFLGASLGITRIETVAIGSLAFSNEGKKNHEGDNPRSFVLAPRRLEKDLPSVANPDLVQKVLLGSEKPRSVELMVRIDVSEPIPFSSLRVFAADEQLENQEMPEPQIRRSFPAREV